MNKKITTFCNRCKDETNHTCLYSKKISVTFESDDSRHPDMVEKKDYMVVQCKGCNHVSFLLRESGSFYTDSEGNPDFIEFNFPEHSSQDDAKFLAYDEQELLPSQLASLYDELQGAFENDSNKLAGVGLRMLVEAICIEQGIGGRNLKLRIEKLHDTGLISKNEIPILDKLREVGNASVHGIKSFSIDKLGYALEILNHVLKSIYVLPKINKKLKI